MPSKETSSGELCSKYAEDDLDLQDKIQCFLQDRSIGTVTGIRRMGRENLVKFVAEMCAHMGISSSIFPDTSGDVILFDHWEEMEGPSKEILDKNPKADILYGQDLCHQVPAVVRYRVEKEE